MDGIVLTLGSPVIGIINITQRKGILHFYTRRDAKSTTNLSISTKRKVAKLRGNHLQHQRNLINHGLIPSVDDTQTIVGNSVNGADITFVTKAIMTIDEIDINARDKSIVLGEIIFGHNA